MVWWKNARLGILSETSWFMSAATLAYFRAVVIAWKHAQKMDRIDIYWTSFPDTLNSCWYSWKQMRFKNSRSMNKLGFIFLPGCQAHCSAIHAWNYAGCTRYSFLQGLFMNIVMLCVLGSILCSHCLFLAHTFYHNKFLFITILIFLLLIYIRIVGSIVIGKILMEMGYIIIIQPKNERNLCVRVYLCPSHLIDIDYLYWLNIVQTK